MFRSKKHVVVITLDKFDWKEFLFVMGYCAGALSRGKGGFSIHDFERDITDREVREKLLVLLDRMNKGNPQWDLLRFKVGRPEPK